MKRSLVAAVAIAVSMLSPGMAHAESAPGCSSVTQIGSTAYIKTGVNTISASVKQFKGCGKNFAYVWVWDSFIHPGRDYEVLAAIYPDGRNPAGAVRVRNKQEVWSKAADTLTVCTRASGTLVDLVGDPSYGYEAFTDKRC